MALINSSFIYKAMSKSNIIHRAYIQKFGVELTGSLDGVSKSLNFKRPTKSSAASSATQNRKKESVTAWDSLFQKTAARILVNRAEIEQLTSVRYVKTQYVESVEIKQCFQCM